MCFIPLSERDSINLHDGVLGQSLGSDHLVVGGIVYDINNPGLVWHAWIQSTLITVWTLWQAVLIQQAAIAKLTYRGRTSKVLEQGAKLVEHFRFDSITVGSIYRTYRHWLIEDVIPNTANSSLQVRKSSNMANKGSKIQSVPYSEYIPEWTMNELVKVLDQLPVSLDSLCFLVYLVLLPKP